MDVSCRASYIAVHGSWRCRGGEARRADEEGRDRVLRAGTGRKTRTLRARAGPDAVRGRRAGHQRGHHLPVAEPPAAGRRDRELLARVGQRSGAALLPADRARASVAAYVPFGMGPLQDRGRSVDRRVPMTTRPLDRIVEDYLRRLDDELGVLPARQQTEIIDEIRDHLAERRADLPEKTKTNHHTNQKQQNNPQKKTNKTRRRFG